MTASKRQTIGTGASYESATASSANRTITNSSAATLAGNTIFVGVMVYLNTAANASGITVSDSAGNTYVKDLEEAGGSTPAQPWLVWFRCSNAAAIAVTTGTITIAASNSYLRLEAIAHEWNGIAKNLAGIDVQFTTTSNVATTALDSGTTPTDTYADSVAFGIFGIWGNNGAAPTFTQGTGFTTDSSSIHTGAGAEAGVASEHNIVTSIQTFDAKATLSGSGEAYIASCIVYPWTYVENVSTAPTQQTTLARVLNALRTPQTVPGPSTLLSALERQASGNASTSVTPSTAVTAQQGIARALSTSVSPSTTVGVSRKVALSTSVTPSTTLVVAITRVSLLTTLTRTLAVSGIGLCSAQVLAGPSGEGPGSADWVIPTVKVEVDWTNTGTWVDESTNYMAVDITRGRTAATDVFAAGTATVVMINSSGRYGPFNTFSALYPNVVGGRPIRIHATFQGTTYARFQGYISEVQENAVPGYAAVTLACIDAFDQFRLSSVKAPLQLNQTTDQVIASILTAAGWAGGTTLATGRTLTTYAQPMTNLLQALQHAAQQDVRGVVFMGRDGTVTFQDADYRATQPVWHVFPSVESEQVVVRYSDLVQSVNTTFSTYSWPKGTSQDSAALSSVYSGQAGLQLPAQAPTVVTDFFTVPAAQFVVTPVAETDYVVNDHADGSGLDVSNNVWVRQFTTTGTQFTATIYNDLPYPVYLQSFQIRGIALQTNQAAPFVLVPSGPNIGNQYVQAFDFATDPTVVGAWAETAYAALRAAHSRPVAVIHGKTAALTQILLGADLSSRIVLSDLVSPHLVGNADQFFIEHYQESFAPATPPKATWTLFDSQQGSL